MSIAPELVRTPAIEDNGLVEAFLAGRIHADALPEPAWGPIGPEVYRRTYSRQVPDGSGGLRGETWAETVRRVVLGNLGYAPESTRLPGEAAELFRMIYSFGILPAGRHLAATGTAMSANRNCFATGWEQRTSAHTSWLAKILFMGGGVGANYSADLTDVTDPIVSSVDVAVACRADHPDYAKVAEFCGGATVLDPATVEVIVVPDTREGWVGAWESIIDRATRPGDARLVFDISSVRAEGSRLVTAGGTASGPAPLARAILDIAEVLRGAVGRRLTGIEFMLLDHAVAAAVCAGGSRRSARMSLMNWRDPEIFDFIAAKATTKAHWTTNLSVEIGYDFPRAIDHPSHPLHDHALAVLDAVATGMALNGEPGFVNTEEHSLGERGRIRLVNPCSEVSLEPYESCNIGSINLDHFGTDFDGVERATRLLARFLYRATLRAYPDEKAAVVEGRNRRLGLGILGLHGWVMAHGVKLTDFPRNVELRDKLTAMRLIAREAADELADRVGTPRSIKVTAVAPTGTISSLAGATPGVSPVIYKYFTRRVRYTSHDPEVADLERRGFLVERDKYAGNTVVVSFPVRDAIMDRFPHDLVEDSTDVTFTQMMSIVQAVQDTLLGGRDGNAVSATAQIPAGQNPAELAEAMLPFIRRGLKGITVFPEVSMEQAPFSPLTQESYEKELSAVAASADFYSSLGDSNDGVNCVNGACPVV